ncbi:MAG: hypothetical protein M1819_003598 [Sarea resinae]|nr:MAG: hypothetical protein M1819_003598 [Sarea resinae]
MVRFYENTFTYDYSFPAVTLAYFLRYPNPYSKHVISTDVIERRFDPETQRLHTSRLHLKRSKLPSALLKILPKSILGPSGGESRQSYILETSIVDVREGWMETESRNLDWTGVLSVIERHTYRRPSHSATLVPLKGSNWTGDLVEHASDEKTDVTIGVTFHSRLGQGKSANQKLKRQGQDAYSHASSDTEDPPAKVGFFKSWSTGSIQRSIEMVGVRRAKEALGRSKEGMNVVLDRLRQGGLVGVLEGMRRDRETAFGPEGHWKRAWNKGAQQADGKRDALIEFDPFEDS